MTDLHALLDRANLLAATRRLATTRRQNVDYRLGLVGELLRGIIADLEPLDDMKAYDPWDDVEAEFSGLPFMED